MAVGTRSELYRRALSVIPGGVNSPVRAFNAVGGTPRFIREAKGAWLTDVARRQSDVPTATKRDRRPSTR